MKKLLLIACFLSAIVAEAQTGYPTRRNNGVNQTQEEYLINTPGNTPGNSRVVQRIKDSTYFEFISGDIYARNLVNSLDQPGASNFIYTDNGGRLKSSSLTRIFPDTNLIFPTYSYLNDAYYDKSESDMRYIQAILIDSSMIVNAIPSLVSNWNTAYSWGNHAGLYVPLSRTLTINGVTQDLSSNRIFTIPVIDTTNLSTRINTKQNNSDTNTWDATRSWVTGLGYATTSALTSGLAGKENTITVGTTAQYWRGDKTWQAFPSIPAQYNPTAGTGISITGTYPNQTISNTAAGQTVTMTPGQNTKITGSHPNFNIADSLTNRYYNSSGFIAQNIKVWTNTVTPSTSNGYSIDISSAGFNTILSAQVIAERNTSSASTSPNVSIKSKSTTAIVVNVVEDNPTTVSILGIAVLSGLPSIFANVTGLTLSVTVIGY